MNASKEYRLMPFVVLTAIYFIVGFLTTINGQFQGPLQIAFLSDAEGLRNTLITLIPFAFFLGYLLNSSLGGKWIDKHGYKTALVRGLLFMVSGLAFYLCASAVGANAPEWGVNLGHDFVPWAYFIFLVGSFYTGTAAAILQVVINPYVSSYELPNTQAVQRLNIVCAINSSATTIAPFFVTGVLFAGVSMLEVTAGQLVQPLIAMTIIVGLVAFVTNRLNLPDIEGTFSSEEVKTDRSVWSFSHLKWGVVAIFFYVGAEVSIGVNINLHAMELIENGTPLTLFGKDNVTLTGLELGIPALLATLYWGGLLIGRSVSSFLKNISERTQLVTASVAAILITIFAIFTENLWVLICVGLCHSIMWGAIFTLAVKGLKEYTSKASGVFMMGVFGGAVFPLIQGVLADKYGSWQFTWSIVIVCEVVILLYALIGSRIKESLDS